jgi:hypothetical protein
VVGTPLLVAFCIITTEACDGGDKKVVPFCMKTEACDEGGKKGEGPPLLVPFCITACDFGGRTELDAPLVPFCLLALATEEA